MGVGVSVAEECGEEVDLRGRGFPSLESLLLRLRRTLESYATGSRIGARDDMNGRRFSPVLLRLRRTLESYATGSRIGVWDDDWSVCPCYNPCY